MNFNNLSRQSVLEESTKKVVNKLEEDISSGTYIDYFIESSRLNRFGDAVIGSHILFRDEEGLHSNRLSHIVIDDVIFQSLPLTALCDND